MRSRPAKTVMIEIHQQQTQQRHQRNDDTYNQEKRSAHSTFFVLKLNSEFRGEFLQLWIPGRQFGIFRYLFFKLIGRLALGFFCRVFRGAGSSYGIIGILTNFLCNFRIMTLHVLQRRLDYLKKRDESSCCEHSADDAHNKAELIAPSILPDATVRFADRIRFIEKLFFVLYCHLPSTFYPLFDMSAISFSVGHLRK